MKIINKTLSIVLVILMVNITLIVLWQVFSRFVLNNSSSFTEELSRYHLIWISLLGAAYITGQRLNLAIDLISDKLSNKHRKVNAIVINVFVGIFAFVVMFIGGANLVKMSFELNQVSSSMPLKIGYVYMVLPLSGILIVIYTLVDIFKTNKI